MTSSLSWITSTIVTIHTLTGKHVYMQLWSVWFRINESCCAPWRARGAREKREGKTERREGDLIPLNQPVSILKTQVALAIFNEIPSSPTPSELTSSPRKLPANIQYERRPTPWMCHMRRTRLTEAPAQSFTPQRPLWHWLNRQLYRFFCFPDTFLLAPDCWDCLDSALSLIYVQPRRRVVFRGGPLKGSWHAGSRLDHSFPVPVDPTEGEFIILLRQNILYYKSHNSDVCLYTPAFSFWMIISQ